MTRGRSRATRELSKENSAVARRHWNAFGFAGGAFDNEQCAFAQRRSIG
jgi:hypothetical protein